MPLIIAKGKPTEPPTLPSQVPYASDTEENKEGSILLTREVKGVLFRLCLQISTLLEHASDPIIAKQTRDARNELMVILLNKTRISRADSERMMDRVYAAFSPFEFSDASVHSVMGREAHLIAVDYQNRAAGIDVVPPKIEKTERRDKPCFWSPSSPMPSASRPASLADSETSTTADAGFSMMRY